MPVCFQIAQLFYNFCNAASPFQKENRKKKAKEELLLICHSETQQQPLLGLPLPPLGLACTAGCIGNTAEKSLSGLYAQQGFCWVLPKPNPEEISFSSADWCFLPFGGHETPASPPVLSQPTKTRYHKHPGWAPGPKPRGSGVSGSSAARMLQRGGDRWRRMLLVPGAEAQEQRVSPVVVQVPRGAAGQHGLGDAWLCSAPKKI